MPILQQEFRGQDPNNLGYRLLIACIMLNQTSNKNVRQVLYSFLDKWSTPQSVVNADPDEIRNHIRPLGFYNRRTTTIIRFSHEYITKRFVNANELYGIGKYANDSYEIFIKGNLNVEPTDKILIKYLNGDFIDQ
jgi:methyl-CpG-binding domain protein 4